MTFKPARLLLALIAIAASFAYSPSFAQNLAVVNGKAIPSSRADAIVKQVVAQGQGTDSPQLREAIKKDLISREVMMQEAIKQGYDKNPEVKAALENARQTIVINALARDYITKHPVSDADIKAEYDRFAKQSKDAGTANNGGDLDWASPSSFPPEFAAGFTNLQKGAITDTPVKTQVGYHVIKLDDVRPAKLPSLDQVKPQISEALTQQKLAAYQQEMVKKAKVQ
jgi:peptidyl-prolyl cis-trans isomerase C